MTEEIHAFLFGDRTQDRADSSPQPGNAPLCGLAMPAHDQPIAVVLDLVHPVGPGRRRRSNSGSPQDVPDRYRDHPFACMQRVSNSARFTSAVAPSILVEAMVFEASNWHSNFSRSKSALSAPGRTQLRAQPATQAAAAKAPIIQSRFTAGPLGQV